MSKIHTGKLLNKGVSLRSIPALQSIQATSVTRGWTIHALLLSADQKGRCMTVVNIPLVLTALVLLSFVTAGLSGFRLCYICSEIRRKRIILWRVCDWGCIFQRWRFWNRVCEGGYLMFACYFLPCSWLLPSRTPKVKKPTVLLGWPDFEMHVGNLIFKILGCTLAGTLWWSKQSLVWSSFCVGNNSRMKIFCVEKK